MTERIHIRVQLEQALETIEDLKLPDMRATKQAISRAIDFLKAEQAAMDRFFQDNQ